jgi:hypothetical protein
MAFYSRGYSFVGIDPRFWSKFQSQPARRGRGRRQRLIGLLLKRDVRHGSKRKADVRWRSLERLEMRRGRNRRWRGRRQWSQVPGLGCGYRHCVVPSMAGGKDIGPTPIVVTQYSVLRSVEQGFGFGEMRTTQRRERQCDVATV